MSVLLGPLCSKTAGFECGLLQKNFNGYIFCFLGHLVGGQLFELFARETNLKKQSSVGSRGRQAAGTMCSSLAHHSLCTVLLQGPNFHLEVCPSRAGFCCDLFQNKNHGF